MLALLVAIALCSACGGSQAQTAPPPTSPAPAPPPPDPAGAFAQGQIRISGGVGFFSSFGHQYVSLALSGGVFVVDGLETGLSVVQWLGDPPLVTKLSPELLYVFWMVPTIKPYIGTFYRHWFITEGIPDLDTTGGRAGIFLQTGMLVIGGGVVVEWAFNGCDADCVFVAPELGISVSF